jgi:hypothetical protein
MNQLAAAFESGNMGLATELIVNGRRRAQDYYEAQRTRVMICPPSASAPTPSGDDHSEADSDAESVVAADSNAGDDEADPQALAINPNSVEGLEVIFGDPDDVIPTTKPTEPDPDFVVIIEPPPAPSEGYHGRFLLPLSGTVPGEFSKAAAPKEGSRRSPPSDTDTEPPVLNIVDPAFDNPADSIIPIIELTRSEGSDDTDIQPTIPDDDRDFEPAADNIQIGRVADNGIELAGVPCSANSIDSIFAPVPMTPTWAVVNQNDDPGAPVLDPADRISPPSGELVGGIDLSVEDGGATLPWEIGHRLFPRAGLCLSNSDGLDAGGAV